MTKTTSISFQDLLDSNGLARGLAILAVVMCHLPFAHAFWKPLGTFASAGKLAVSVFLFSSGLLLQYQSNRAGGAIRPLPWLKKRLWRIYPVYWVGVVLAVLGAWAFRGRTYDAGTLAANVLGIPLLVGKKAVSAGYTVPFWFISVLLLCYGLFLFVHRVRHKVVLVLGAGAVSAVALRTGAVMEAAALAFPSFFMGMALADRWRNTGAATSDARIHAAVFLPLLAALAFVFKGARFFHLDAGGAFGLDLAGCAGLTVVPWPLLFLIAAFQKTLARFAPAALRGLQWFSGFAFAVYCLHEPFLRVLEYSTAAGHPWIGLLGYAILTLGAAWAVDAAERKWKGKKVAG